MKKVINTIHAPATIGYSQAIEINNTIYLSGQIPFDPETMILKSNDIGIQTRQILINIKAILENLDSSLNDIIKITIYITKMEDFIIVNKVYKEFFKNIEVARSLLEVSNLPKNSKIMIDLIAFKTKKQNISKGNKNEK